MLVCVCVYSLSHVCVFVAPWTVARQAPLSMEFSRQEYWSRLPFPSSEELPDPGIKPKALPSPALARGLFYQCATREYVWAPGPCPSHLGYASLKETALAVGVREQTPREWTPLTPATLRSGEKHQLDRAGQKVLVLGLTQPHQQMCSWVPPTCLAPETPGPQTATEAHPRMEINWRLRSLLTSLLVTHSSTVSDLTSYF